MLSYLNHLARAGLSVAEGREQGPQLATAAAVLAAGDEGAEAGSSLREQTIDFRLAPAGSLADLDVGVALREQAQGPQLGRLQCLQGLAAASHVLAALDLCLGPVAGSGDQRHRIFRSLPVALIAEQLLATSPYCQRLVLSDRLGPANQFA